MILQGSRYVGGTIVSAPDRRGVMQIGVQRPGVTASLILEQIQGGAGTRLDLIAARIFGDATLWWMIADANPQLGYPDEFSPGIVLNIPDASIATS